MCFRMTAEVNILKYNPGLINKVMRSMGKRSEVSVDIGIEIKIIVKTIVFNKGWIIFRTKVINK